VAIKLSSHCVRGVAWHRLDPIFSVTRRDDRIPFKSGARTCRAQRIVSEAKRAVPLPSVRRHRVGLAGDDDRYGIRLAGPAGCLHRRSVADQAGRDSGGVSSRVRGRNDAHPADRSPGNCILAASPDGVAVYRRAKECGGARNGGVWFRTGCRTQAGPKIRGRTCGQDRSDATNNKARRWAVESGPE
jgi:hypothetical protein